MKFNCLIRYPTEPNAGQTVVLRLSYRSTLFVKKTVCSAVIAAFFATTVAVSPQVTAQSLPDLGDAADGIVTEPQERAIGKRIMLDVRGDRAFVDDPELADYITTLGNRLVTASRGATNDNRRDFEFFILNDDSINAFALLGGFVGFHSGLILASRTESELAGVMGHEIAHVTQRHAARGAMGQRSGGIWQLAALAAAILAARSGSASAGQATEAAIVGSQALAIQNQLDYTRDFEREADRIGIQIMMRASYDPQGMVGFFERLLRANRHNEGKVPGYLRTHPLTTERIADMQSRIDQLTPSERRLTAFAENPDYKFAQAKLRVMSLGTNEAILHFREAIAERTILRNRADVYGLALAYLRARDFATAEAQLASVRTQPAPHPWIENLQAEIKLAQRKFDESIDIYKSAGKRFPDSRALSLGLIEAHFQGGRIDDALALAIERLKTIQDDPKLHELAAKCFERKGKRMAQHRAIGESYYRRSNLVGAIEQLEIALKARDGDFYEQSSTEARLREFKAEYKNRPLLPGEKRRDTEDDRDGRDGREPRKLQSTAKKPASSAR
jgi:beta-barrel assembly-enhancing protease